MLQKQWNQDFIWVNISWSDNHGSYMTLQEKPDNDFVCHKAIVTWPTSVCLQLEHQKEVCTFFVPFHHQLPTSLTRIWPLKKTPGLTLSALNFSSSYSIWTSSTLRENKCGRKKQQTRSLSCWAWLLVSLSSLLEIIMAML